MEIFTNAHNKLDGNVFFQIYNKVYSAVDNISYSYEIFLKFCMIQSLKSVFFRQSLYIGNAYLHSREAINTLELIPNILDEYNELGRWIFNEKKTVFKNKYIVITIGFEGYIVEETDAKVILKSQYLQQLVTFVKSSKNELFSINNRNYKMNLLEFLGVLSSFEVSKTDE